MTNSTCPTNHIVNKETDCILSAKILFIYKRIDSVDIFTDFFFYRYPYYRYLRAVKPRSASFHLVT